MRLDGWINTISANKASASWSEDVVHLCVCPVSIFISSYTMIGCDHCNGGKVGCVKKQHSFLRYYSIWCHLTVQGYVYVCVLTIKQFYEIMFMIDNSIRSLSTLLSPKQEQFFIASLHQSLAFISCNWYANDLTPKMEISFLFSCSPAIGSVNEHASYGNMYRLVWSYIMRITTAIFLILFSVFLIFPFLCILFLFCVCFFTIFVFV